MTDSVFRGTYSDFRFVKSRKVCQIIVEVPVEGANAALDALGGVPRPDKETWVAVARLNTKASHAASDAAQDAKTQPKYSLTRQAAMLCGDKRFQAFVVDHCGGDVFNVDEAGAAAWVRETCRVDSRSRFDSDEDAGRRWAALYADYLRWCQE